MEENNNWRFCAVGNIVKQHCDTDGTVFYGTKAFKGGTKVYIYDNNWNPESTEVTVIGLNRFGKYKLESVSCNEIERVRVQCVFKPVILDIFAHEEIMEGAVWHLRTADDKRALKQFVTEWNNRGINAAPSEKV